MENSGLNFSDEIRETAGLINLFSWIMGVK